MRSASLGASLNNLSSTRLTLVLGILPLSAQAQTELQLVSILADSEQSKILTFIPAAELSHSTKKESVWSAGLQLQMSALHSGDPQTYLNIKVKEAALTRNTNTSSISLGRILLRSQVLGLNEMTRMFMRPEPTTDGIQFHSKGETVHWSVYGGAPQVAGFSFGQDYGSTKMSLFYRGERNKISIIPIQKENGLIENSLRAAHTHEAEITLRTSARKVHTEALFQLLNQGPQKRATLIDDTLGEFTIGSVDTTLPHSFNDYRIAVQTKFPIVDTIENAESLVLAWGSRTTSRFHNGSEDERFSKQGGGNEAQLSVALEVPSAHFTLQIGSAVEYSSTPKYSFMAKRLSSGVLDVNKTKGTVWTSVRAQF